MPETITSLTPPYPLRSNAEKRHAVLALLHDPVWCQCSNRAIARQCGVDHKTVGKWRKELSGECPQMERTVQRNGTTYTLHLPVSQHQAQPQPSRMALTIAEVLVVQGLAPSAAQWLLTRLQALPPGKRRQVERMVQELLL
jgi:hypothetical protein